MNWKARIVAGGFNDPGLQFNQYHILPWNVQECSAVEIIQEKANVVPKLSYDEKNRFQDFIPEQALKIAKFNIDTVLKFGNLTQDFSDFDRGTLVQLRKDALSILTIMAAFNFYDRDCRAATDAEREAIRTTAATQAELDEIFGLDQLKRVSEFITARIDTKYRSNHGLGGTSPQNSFPDELKKLFDLRYSDPRMKIIKEVIYWSTRPLNETLLIPYIVLNSKITKTRVHTEGFIPSNKTIEEHFTPTKIVPARTSNFLVADLCAAKLKSIGILNYLPGKERLDDLEKGIEMIQHYGAALHPSARDWGLEPKRANQNIIESLCADLCFAFNLHFPKDPLVRKPIFAKKNLLNPFWERWNINYLAEMKKKKKNTETGDLRNTSDSNNKEEGIPGNVESWSGAGNRGKPSSSKRHLSDAENDFLIDRPALNFAWTLEADRCALKIVFEIKLSRNVVWCLQVTCK
ncbi:putative effector protein [Erysiphe neolycopersici]|uniref:Putative effector protein n=1 Tax=Erysiphe neolycopersici TaxID=212602 RepID=A0A420HVK3_9PEZI|nr:putative effector protein [Erysiphe neolycopersici]